MTPHEKDITAQFCVIQDTIEKDESIERSDNLKQKSQVCSYKSTFNVSVPVLEVEGNLNSK